MTAGVDRGKTLSSVVVASDDTVAMLAELAARPADHELRRRTAEALDDGGRYQEAIAVLAPLVNLTGHDDDTELPCLCKRCLPAALETFQRSQLALSRLDVRRTAIRSEEAALLPFVRAGQ
jgi:thioredoxin-like negative regulator of GroEL